MKMIRWGITATALVLAPSLLLSGCGTSTQHPVAAPSATAPCPTGSAAAGKLPAVSPMDNDATLPTVSGSFGHGATITSAKADPSGRFVVKVLAQGSGPLVSKEDIVGFGLVAQTWAGKPLADSYTTGGGTIVENMRNNQLLPMFSQAMVGHKVGSRVLVVAPPAAGFGNAGSPQLGITCHDTLNLVIDIIAAARYDGTAQGTPETVSADLPKVEVTSSGATSFTITNPQRHPKKLGVGVLIRGTGPVVRPGQNLIAQYTGALLKNGTVFDSSWKHGGAASFLIGKGQVIPGWDKGLVGQTVGSRVILSIPATDGYGAQANQAIPANSDLVFVVDILGAA